MRNLKYLRPRRGIVLLKFWHEQHSRYFFGNNVKVPLYPCSLLLSSLPLINGCFPLLSQSLQFRSHGTATDLPTKLRFPSNEFISPGMLFLYYNNNNQAKRGLNRQQQHMLNGKPKYCCINVAFVLVLPTTFLKLFDVHFWKVTRP